MTTHRMRHYAVDRVEGRTAVLMDDDERTVELPLARLPRGAGEGSVLAVPLDARGRPDWDAAELDEAERTRRMDEARALLERLKREDPGGDLEL